MHQKPTTINNLRRNTLATTADTYQNLSDDEFNPFLSFLRSPVGKRSIAVSREVFKRFLAEAAQSLITLAKKAQKN